MIFLHILLHFIYFQRKILDFNFTIINIYRKLHQKNIDITFLLLYYFYRIIYPFFSLKFRKQNLLISHQKL